MRRTPARTRRTARALGRAIAFAPLLALSCFNNEPYSAADQEQNTFYDTFREEPTHLDPARSYSTDQARILELIYEPPVQYHYLKRPYELMPRTLESLPKVTYYDTDGGTLPPDAPAAQVARAVYEMKVKRGVRYQEHACFARTPHGKHRWHLGFWETFPQSVENPDDLPEEKGSRELRAEDYVYQIKRLAHPSLQCPLFSTFAKYIDGMDEYAKRLEAALVTERQRRKKELGARGHWITEQDFPIYLDLRDHDFPGVEIVDAFTFRIHLKRKYPQFKFWLAMTFFAPMPWEADRFYLQHAAAAAAFSLDRFPVGTGPFRLTFNRPNWRIILDRNDKFAGREFYPVKGTDAQREADLLADAGQPLPFLGRVVFSLEKEQIPRWNKFVQGYYDTSLIAEDVYDQAVQTGENGVDLTEQMRARKIRLVVAREPWTSYFGFNMLDEVVGGYGEKKKKLRQAIAIAFDIEEYIQVFLNGRGLSGHGPVPPEIFGYLEGPDFINRIPYSGWDGKTHAPVRRGLDEARRRLAEAGYPEGIDPKTGKKLVLFYEGRTGQPGEKAFQDWLRKQFGKLGVSLQVRGSDYSRFQDKVRQGNWQILRWGFVADYPDPENFLFLLYGPNGVVKSQGANATNYDNPAYNKLFEKMESMENSPERLAVIKEMVGILNEDAVWFGVFNPVGYGLYHGWNHNAQPVSFMFSSLKYRRIDTGMRARAREAWNRPVLWPFVVAGLLLVLGTIPAIVAMIRRERGVPSS